MEPPGKSLWLSTCQYRYQKRLKFYKLRNICGILHQEYLKMRFKKVNSFKDINLGKFIKLKLFFDLEKFDISFMPITWPDS